ncbi:cytochrome b [Celeribacter indicus]|uniref:Cytochrome B561 n=1 Tax=Celeribacter indicus TaxID=1208324 RepID=A0A0B5DTS2_9RHOB|nr:cytochrome b/b6 domain-containing protein [Celeribacter indicus]AJE46828.1 cytochrome B561 [Celeribacter indicus]SDW80898.1 cytochrome b561 [Celeribacter indicus]
MKINDVLLDTPAAYGLVSRILHWALAALLLWQLTGMALKLALGRQPLVAFFVGLHQQIGTVIFLLVVLRILWMFAMRRRRPTHADGLLGAAAKAGHALLYVVMLLVPLSALIRAAGSTRGFAPFGVTIFPPRETELGWTAQVGESLHGEMGWILAVLIGGHVAMVALHEALWRDGTLRRMAGRG